MRLRSIVRRGRVEQELDRELRFHLEQQVEENLAAGMVPAEARYAALRRLGGVEQIKEECRDMRRVHYVENLFRDVHYGLRMLGKAPGLTAIMAITLGLGIGANTAIFSLVNGFLLRPLPVAAPEQITVLAIQQKGAPVGSSGFSYPEFVDFRRQAEAFLDLFATALGRVELIADDRSDQCFINYVSRNFFSALGIKPALGRFILPSEGEVRGEQPVVVLGYSYWQKRFRGDPGVTGHHILVDGKPATIIGVAPEKFPGMFSIFEVDFYLPISALTLEETPNLAWNNVWNNRDLRRLLVFGRLKPGVSLAQAQSSLDVIVERLAGQYPATDKWINVRALPEKLSRPIPYANNFFIMTGGLFLVLAGCVLLLACMNVENILLARGAARRREMGIRLALGAGRGRLMGQMLTESILLALLGGIIGLLFGFWASRLMSLAHPKDLPLRTGFSFDWRVYAYALASTLFTGIVCGLWPALHASRSEINLALHEDGQGSKITGGIPRFRNLLIVAQVAGSFALLVVAGLFVRSLRNVQRFDLGFDPDHVLNVILDPGRIGYDRARTTEFYRALETRVGSLPGVQSVCLAAGVPMGESQGAASVFVEGRPLPPGQSPPRVRYNNIDGPYFQTMRISLLRGRAFTESDSQSAPLVAIINQTMATRFWPRENPLEKRFSVTGPTGPFIEVVGIAKDGKYVTLGEDPTPYVYVPLAQNFTSRRALQIRTAVPPESLAVNVKAEIRQLAPSLNIIDLRTMKQSLEGALGFFVFRLAASLGGAIGIIGLILAIVGVYGIVSFAASQRTREIGIRMALGANSRDVLNLVLGQGVRLVMVGVAIGMIGAWALTRSMINLLVGINPADPLTYASVAILLLVVGLLACYIPARRATNVDPMVALRYE
jgi:predicted permease